MTLWISLQQCFPAIRRQAIQRHVNRRPIKKAELPEPKIGEILSATFDPIREGTTVQPNRFLATLRSAFALSLLICLCIPAVPTWAASSQVCLRNTGDALIYVAVLYRGPWGGWISHGWWHVEPRDKHLEFMHSRAGRRYKFAFLLHSSPSERHRRTMGLDRL